MGILGNIHPTVFIENFKNSGSQMLAKVSSGSQNYLWKACSNIVGLWWSPRIYISNKLPGDSLGIGATLWGALYWVPGIEDKTRGLWVSLPKEPTARLWGKQTAEGDEPRTKLDNPNSSLGSILHWNMTLDKVTHLLWALVSLFIKLEQEQCLHTLQS